MGSLPRGRRPKSDSPKREDYDRKVESAGGAERFKLGGMLVTKPAYEHFLKVKRFGAFATNSDAMDWIIQQIELDDVLLKRGLETP